ncbi:MAG: tRNA-dihydrouridine synthase family protein [Verrucomicrobia bacterium]|nr:tRNA-dihydrouridine synthase family protein [Verrucomicrobiota bacterium]
MEGVGDRCFRKAMASIGGFDEAVTDFIRVPRNAHVESLARVYDPEELAPIPIAAQLMGSDPELMAEMARAIERKGAPRIDLNCGCPSNTVTGRGAGSSLLQDPSYLHEVAKAIVRAVKIPVTIKMRSGFADLSLFEENLLAAESSGAAYLTLHPRTKVDGYGPPARWDLIRRAKEVVKIPVVGNGDILTVEDAMRMQEETGCDGWMIGRGSVINPFVFHQIKAHLAGTYFEPRWEDLLRFFAVYQAEIPKETRLKVQVNKLKQLMSFLFKKNSGLLALRGQILTSQAQSPEAFLEEALPLLRTQSGFRH